MKRMSSWLLIFFMVIFWVFRVVVAIETQMGQDFGGFTTYDFNMEIIMLFVAVVCFIFILKRNSIGGIVYLGGYVYYFGGYLLVDAIPKISNGSNMSLIQNMAVAILAIFLALFVFIDIIIDGKTNNNHKDNKTDWFFKNEKLDRKLDDRADTNQYRHY